MYLSSEQLQVLKLATINESAYQHVLEVLGYEDDSLLKPETRQDKPSISNAAAPQGPSIENDYAVSHDLRLSDESYIRDLLDSLFVYAGLSTPDGVIVEVNNAVLNASDVQREDVIGKFFWDAYWWGYTDKIRNRIKHGFRRATQGETVRMQIVGRMGEERYLHIELMMSPLIDSHGDVIAVLNSGYDISDSIALELNLLRSGIEKERQEILARFVTEVSHEFRTPLASISSSAHMLGKMNDPERRMVLSQRIETQVTAITKLVDTMLTLVRLETSFPNFDVTPLNIAEILSDLCENFRSTAEQKSIFFTTEIPSTPVRIAGNSQEIRLACHHLIENAIRFTNPDKSVHIQLIADDLHTTLCIEDTGAGIPPEIQPHIFDRFYRADTMHTTGGFGLGLPIVKKIIDRHAGHIHVKSEKFKGTTFTIHLPLAQPQTTAMTQKGTKEPASSPDRDDRMSAS